MSLVQILFIVFGVVFVPYVLSDGVRTLRELFNDAKK